VSDTDAFTRVCGQPAADGSTFCENKTNTSWFEGAGWRCRFHMPAGEHWPHERRGVNGAEKDGPALPEPPPKGGAIESIEDALAMIAWATKELSCGRITESKCRGVINGAKAYLAGLGATHARDEVNEMREALRKIGAMK